MADEFTIKMPEFNPTINVTINGENQLRDFVITINRMMDGADYQNYYKPDTVLLEELHSLCKTYQEIPTLENAQKFINTYNAYLAKSNKGKARINDLSDETFSAVLKVKSKIKDADCFSLDQFLTAFYTFDNLKDYGINLSEFFNLFSKK